MANAEGVTWPASSPSRQRLVPASLGIGQAGNQREEGLPGHDAFALQAQQGVARLRQALVVEVNRGPAAVVMSESDRSKR